MSAIREAYLQMLKGEVHQARITLEQAIKDELLAEWRDVALKPDDNTPFSGPGAEQEPEAINLPPEMKFKAPDQALKMGAYLAPAEEEPEVDLPKADPAPAEAKKPKPGKQQRPGAISVAALNAAIERVYPGLNLKEVAEQMGFPMAVIVKLACCKNAETKSMHAQKLAEILGPEILL